MSSSNEYSIAFTDWLATRTFENDDLFYEVNKIGTGLVTVSYFTDKSNTVDEFLDKIEDILSEEFSDDIIDNVFGIHNGIKITRSANRNTQRYLSTLAAKSKSNPQSNECDVSKGSKIHIYYGPTPSSSTSEPSYANIASKSKTVPNNELEALRATVEKLDRNQKQLEETITTNVTNNVSAEFNTKIDKMDKTINDRITKVESKHKTTINTLFEEWEQRNQETKSMILGMCSGHDESTQAPSDNIAPTNVVPGVSQ